jgi:hypothetical protein
VASGGAVNPEGASIGDVRRWARTNGYAAGARGRIPYRTLMAYNNAHGTNVVDRSGRQSKSWTEHDLAPPSQPGKSGRGTVHITVTVTIVNEDGSEVPFRRELLTPLSAVSHQAASVTRPVPRDPEPFRWPR